MVPQNLREKQLTILDQFRRMKMINSLTCTPYYLKKPTEGAHLAWAESSAVVYTNSVLDSFTNREGGPSALAAAVIGKTPDYGIHRLENRRPTALVNLETSLRDETEFGALGIHLGKILGDKIPSIPALKNSNESGLKQFGAALATSGMVNLFHRRVIPKKSVTEEISVESQDVRRTAESLSTASNRNPDLVFVGCPHCSPQEIRQVAGLIKGRKVKSSLEFWICTSCHVKNKEKQSVRQIEACGGHVLAGVCTVVSWTEKLGIETIMTNSAKTAYYAPTLNKAKTIFAPLDQCLNAALEG
jgi:predicted aconitase